MNVYQNHNTFWFIFRHANKIKRLHFSHAGCRSEISQIPGCRRTLVTRSLNNSSVHVSGISDVICNDQMPPCHCLPEYIYCKGFIFNFILNQPHQRMQSTMKHVRILYIYITCLYIMMTFKIAVDYGIFAGFLV